MIKFYTFSIIFDFCSYTLCFSFFLKKFFFIKLYFSMFGHSLKLLF